MKPRSRRSLLALAARPARRSRAGSKQAATEPAASRAEADDDPIAQVLHRARGDEADRRRERHARDAARRSSQAAETLLSDGAFTNAAVALYAIVKSPRYAAFTDFVEYQNAEYDLAVALARSGAYGAALDIDRRDPRARPRARRTGAPRTAAPSTSRSRPAITPASSRASRRSRSTRADSADRPPASARTCAAAPRTTRASSPMPRASSSTISKKSRLYSSAVYLRGVIRARRGEYQGVGRGDVRDRGDRRQRQVSRSSSTIATSRSRTSRASASAGIAHESGEYDDAYYHYFQIPDDSAYLPDALFEAAWSMYQKRELATARDLVKEFLKEFPTLAAVARGEPARRLRRARRLQVRRRRRSGTTTLVAKLQPIVDEMDRVRKDPELPPAAVREGASRASSEVKATGEVAGTKPGTETRRRRSIRCSRCSASIPKFLRLNDAVTGIDELAEQRAARSSRQWQNLAQAGQRDARSARSSTDEDARAGAARRRERARRGSAPPRRSRSPRSRARSRARKREGTHARRRRREGARAARRRSPRRSSVALAQRADGRRQGRRRPPPTQASARHPADDRGRHRRRAPPRQARRTRSRDKLAARGRQARAAARSTSSTTTRARCSTRPSSARSTRSSARSASSTSRSRTSRPGRFPEELIGRLWNASMIGDDEEYWPFEGEYWADEYSGWR